MQNNEHFRKVFPARLRQARLYRGLSHEALAIKVGVEHPGAWYWEHGRNFPRVDTLVKLAEVLGVSLDWLFGIDVKTADSKKEFDATLNGYGQETAPEVGGKYGNEGVQGI